MPKWPDLTVTDLYSTRRLLHTVVTMKKHQEKINMLPRLKYHLLCAYINTILNNGLQKSCLVSQIIHQITIPESGWLPDLKKNLKHTRTWPRFCSADRGLFINDFRAIVLSGMILGTQTVNTWQRLNTIAQGAHVFPTLSFSQIHAGTILSLERLLLIQSEEEY